MKRRSFGLGIMRNSIIDISNAEHRDLPTEGLLSPARYYSSPYNLLNSPRKASQCWNLDYIPQGMTRRIAPVPLRSSATDGYVRELPRNQMPLFSALLLHIVKFGPYKINWGPVHPHVPFSIFPHTPKRHVQVRREVRR